MFYPFLTECVPRLSPIPASGRIKRLVADSMPEWLDSIFKPQGQNPHVPYCLARCRLSHILNSKRAVLV
jgi:hypothetical protein